MSSTNAFKLNLDAFIQSVENLSNEVENNINAQNKIIEKSQETTVSTLKASALYDGLKVMFGIDDLKVELNESKMIQITVEILKLKACLVLDPSNNNKLFDIKILNQNHIQDIDSKDILTRCILLQPPNDIRQAIYYLQTCQESQKILKTDIQELKKKCLISCKDSNIFTVSFHNNVIITLYAHCCYPNVAGGIQIIEVLVDNQVNEDIKILGNQQLFHHLNEMYLFLFEKLV